MKVSVEKPGSPLEVLKHHGAKGMKWGIRKERTSSPELKKQAKKSFTDKSMHLVDIRFEQMFNVDGLTVHDYNKMSTRSTSIPAGKTLYRMTRDPKDTSLSGHTFVTTNKKDAEVYRGLLPAQRPFNQLRKSDYKQHYEIALKTNKTLRGPSEKERVDILAKLMSDKTAVNGKMSLREHYRRSKVITRKDSKNLTDLQLALKVHRRIHQTMWDRKNKASLAFMNEVGKRGYDIISDDNDSGIISKNPVIVLNPKSSTKLIKTTALSNDDILNAQIKLRFPGNK